MLCSSQVGSPKDEVFIFLSHVTTDSKLVLNLCLAVATSITPSNIRIYLIAIVCLIIQVSRYCVDNFVTVYFRSSKQLLLASDNQHVWELVEILSMGQILLIAWKSFSWIHKQKVKFFKLSFSLATSVFLMMKVYNSFPGCKPELLLILHIQLLVILGSLLSSP